MVVAVASAPQPSCMSLRRPAGPSSPCVVAVHVQRVLRLLAPRIAFLAKWHHPPITPQPLSLSFRIAAFCYCLELQLLPRLSSRIDSVFRLAVQGSGRDDWSRPEHGVEGRVMSARICKLNQQSRISMSVSLLGVPGVASSGTLSRHTSCSLSARRCSRILSPVALLSAHSASGHQSEDLEPPL
jgi:hypothetical protein